jgi:hypothetical protein
MSSPNRLACLAWEVSRETGSVGRGVETAVKYFAVSGDGGVEELGVWTHEYMDMTVLK